MSAIQARGKPAVDFLKVLFGWVIVQEGTETVVFLLPRVRFRDFVAQKSQLVGRPNQRAI